MLVFLIVMPLASSLFSVKESSCGRDLIAYALSETSHSRPPSLTLLRYSFTPSPSPPVVWIRLWVWVRSPAYHRIIRRSTRVRPYLFWYTCGTEKNKWFPQYLSAEPAIPTNAFPLTVRPGPEPLAHPDRSRSHPKLST